MAKIQFLYKKKVQNYQKCNFRTFFWCKSWFFVIFEMFFFSIHWFETRVNWVNPGMKPLFLNKFMSGRRPRMNLWKNKGFMTGLTNFWLRKWIENKNFLNFSTIYEMLIALKFSKRFSPLIQSRWLCCLLSRSAVYVLSRAKSKISSHFPTCFSSFLYEIQVG